MQSINAADVLTIVQEVVDQVALVVRFISAFAIIAGAIILASTVAGTRLRRTRETDNPNLSYRILVTMLDRRNRTHRNIHEQLRATFGAGVFNTVIELDTKLRESPIAGVPITHYRPNSRGSQQYRVLAQELIEYAKEEANRQAAQ